MKVLYIIHSTELGGATISFLNMIIGLMKQGITPIVVTPRGTDEKFESILKANGIDQYKMIVVPSVIFEINWRRFGDWFINTMLLPYYKHISYKQLSVIVESLKPSIIHTNVGVIHEGYRVAQKYKIPHVWHLREYQTLDFKWKILPSKKSFCSKLNRSEVITITDDIRRYFNLYDNKNASTIYNGIFSKNDVQFEYPKEKYFLCASRVSVEKGHLDVIRAFSGFVKKYKDYRLKVLGVGPADFLFEVKELARKLQCIEKIDFVGFQDDVKPWMSKATCLLVASYNEGFGRMTAEASFCGTLVIGRNTGGTKEIINKTGGMLFNSVKELEDKMNIVAALSEEEYTTRVMSSQKIACNTYSIESNIENVMSIYEKLLGKK